MSREHIVDDSITDPDTAWADFGRCAGVDPDVFFPRPGDDTSRAKSLCQQCPVRSACLEWALDTNQKHGIWGGMTEGQRRRLRRPVVVSAPAVRHLHLVR
jgi:WhiB family redox-sensing transcriptional regulator